MDCGNIFIPDHNRVPLKEILGENYKGTVICDCWRAYDFLGKLQRCWSHLLRKAEEFINNIAGRHLYERLELMFEEIKRFNSTNPIKKEREKKYKIMTEELQSTIKYYSKYEELKDVITYIGNNIGNWFTCVKYEGIEPTNNFAEQALRDGGQYADNERYNLQRTKYLQKKGYHVIRFWNNEVLQNSTPT